VQSTDRPLEKPLVESITLSDDVPEAALSFEVEAPPPEANGEDTLPVDPGPDAGVPKRRLPRWASIVGISVGAAAVVAGGVLIGVHGRCPDGSDPVGPNACLDVLSTRGAGIGVLVGGAALLTGFSIALGIGETRDNKRRRTEAMVGYTFRF
jgi:hypothetical protein